VGTGSEQIGIALMLVLPAIMQNGQGSDEWDEPDKLGIFWLEYVIVWFRWKMDLVWNVWCVWLDVW
jgi:hypothetical protein